MSNENTTNQSSGPELSHVIDMPGGKEFQDVVNKFNRKAAGEGLKWFIKYLGTMTEPFFRRGMGQRYYGYGDFFPALCFWLCFGIFGYRNPREFSGFAALGHYQTFSHLRWLLYSPWIPVLAAIAMILFHSVVGVLNVKASLDNLRTGKHQHSRSRGLPRWRNEIAVFIKIEIVLVMLNWPIALLFAIGYAMNATLKSAQDDAIRSKYLDALDAALENEHLKDAALGDGPVDLTYLYHPIDPTISRETRVQMADALVGQPVKIVATGPRKMKPRSENGPPADDGTSAPKPTTPPSSKPTEQPQPRPTQSGTQSFAKPAESVRTAEPPQAPQTSAKAKSNPSPIFQPAAAAEAMKEKDPDQYASLWRISRFVRRCFILVLILTPIVLLGYGVVHLIRSQTHKVPAVVAQADQPQPSTAPPQNANPPTPQAPQDIPKAVVPDSVSSAAVQPAKALPPLVTPPPEQAVSVARNDSPPPQTPQVIPKPSIPESPSPSAVQLAKTLTPPATPTPEHTGGVAAELDAYKKFEAYCTATFKEEEERVQQLPDNSNTDELRKEVHPLKRSLQQILHTQYATMRDLRSGVSEDEAAARALPPMFASRQSASNSLLRLHNEIDKATNK